MKRSPTPKPSFSPSDKTKIILVSIFLTILLVILGFLMGLMLRQSGFKFSWPALPALQRQAQTNFPPTLAVSATKCSSTSTLVIGSTTYQIQKINPAPASSLTVLPNTSGVAYWVEGTNNNYVFLLSPTSENLALQTSVKAGNGMTVFWEDCRFQEYTVSSIQPVQSNDPSLVDQSTPGMTILVQSDPSAVGFAIRSVEGHGVDTTSQSEISADISLIETKISPDRTTISLGVSILNFGTSPFTILAREVSMIPENAEPVGTISTSPLLPREIQPGTTETIYFTFPHPSAPAATLKILSVELDIPDY